MTIFRYIVTICMAIQILHACSAFAASGDGGRADAFYNYGAGARSLGMGKAFVAVADSAEAMYWNPAGLMQVEKMELSTLSSELFYGYKFNYHGFVWPMPDQVFAFHSAALTSPTFEGRDSQNNLTSSFNDSKSSLGGSFATKLSPALSLGINYKKFTRSLASYTDDVTLIDGGVLYYMDRLRVGLTAMNLVAMTDVTKTSDKFDMNLRAGVAYQINDNFLLAFDLGDGLSHWFAGTEFMLHPAIALRGGVNYDEFTWGVGLNLDPFYADYSDGSMELGHASRFSIRFKIGGSTHEQKQQIAAQLNETGIHAYQNGFFLTSHYNLAKALELEPDNAKLKVRLDKIQRVVSIMSMSDLEKEMKAYEFFKKAEEAYKQANFSEAQNQIERALKIYPDNPSLFIMQQKIAEKQGQ